MPAEDRLNIGMKEIYDELKTLSGRVGTLTIELKHSIDTQEKANQQFDVKYNDHELRIRLIEKWQNSIPTDHETRLKAVEKWISAIPATLITACSSVVATVLMMIFGNGGTNGQ